MNKIAATYEILGAFASHADEAQLESVIAEVAAEVSFVQNADKEVNLTLPYYSFLGNAKSEAITDANLDEVSGGEVFVSVIIVGAAAAVIATGAGVGFAAKKKSKQGKNLDGSDK